MEQPSSSQLATSSAPKIFVDGNGTPLTVFVESGIPSRIKVIQFLKRNGASLEIEPNDASILLVNPDDGPGRQFVREWGSDKVVLDYKWVFKCEKAGRALMQFDNWADCHDLDGTSVDDNFEGDADDLAPAISHKKQKRTPKSTNGVSKVHSSKPADQPPMTKELPPTPSQNVPLPTPPSSGSNPVLNYNPNPSFNINDPPQPFVNPFPMNSAPQPSQQFTPQALSALAAAMFNMAQQQQQQQSSALVLQAAQHNPMALLAQLMSQGPYSQMQTPATTWPSSEIFPGTSNYSFANPINNLHDQNVYPTTQPYPSSSNQFTPNPTPAPSNPQSSSSQSKNEQRISETPPASSQRKGKKRAFRNDEDDEDYTDSSSERRSPKRRTSHSSPVSRQYGRRTAPNPTLFFASPSQPSQPSSSQPGPSKPPPIGCFTDKNGFPMQIYVQLLLHDRMQLVGLIRNNGGVMASSMKTAKYIILSPTSKQFAECFKEVQAYDRQALRATFIRACDEAQAIVPEADHVIPYESLKLKKGRGRPNVVAKKRAAAVVAAAAAAAVLVMATHSTDDSSSSVSRTTERIRSPTPPQNYVKAKHGSGNHYATEERDYALRYAKYRYLKDSHTSAYSLAKGISTKITTHSETSWLSFLRRGLHDELENVRSEVVAEKRARREEVVNETIEREDVFDILQPASPTNDSNIPVNGIKSPKVEEEEILLDVQQRQEPKKEDEDGDLAWDLQTITNFFAADPDGDDQEQWEALSGLHKCRSANSWQEFYEERKDEIINMLRHALHVDEEYHDAAASEIIPESPAPAN